MVALASVAAGIGSLSDGIGGLVGGTLAAIVGLVVFSFFIYLVGTKLLATAQTEATTKQVMRTLGFAYSPQVLSVVGFIPVLGPIVMFVAGVWVLVTSVVAIRQALEMSTLRAIATAVIAFIPTIIVFAVLTSVFNMQGM